MFEAKADEHADAHNISEQKGLKLHVHEQASRGDMLSSLNASSRNHTNRVNQLLQQQQPPPLTADTMKNYELEMAS